MWAVGPELRLSTQTPGLPSRILKPSERPPPPGRTGRADPVPPSDVGEALTASTFPARRSVDKGAPCHGKGDETSHRFP